MHTEALIFDCDGTLADTMPAHYRAWVDVLRPHGIPFPEDRFYALAGTPTREIVRILATEAGKVVDVLAVVKTKEEAFLLQIAEVVPIARIVEIARAARGLHPMAVASGGQRRIVERTLQQIGILDWFGAIVTSEDTVRHKPDPDLFLEAARRLGVPPEICTVYEDADLGIEAAKRAGMKWVDVRVYRRPVER
jgi:beta-phosphoglucomutase-like phosphatase (HAD superfamily)